MKHLTDILEGILDSNLDISDNTATFHALMEYIRSGMPFPEAHEKFVKSLDKSALISCADFASVLRKYDVLAIPKSAGTTSGFRVITQANSKMWLTAVWPSEIRGLTISFDHGSVLPKYRASRFLGGLKLPRGSYSEFRKEFDK